MPKLTIVIGSNGAGKSTWCRGNREQLPEHFYDADSIAEGLGDWNSPSRQREARAVVERAIRTHLDNQDDFGFESTYSGRSRPDVVRQAAAAGYEIRAVFIGTTAPAINITRVRKRVAAGRGHDVPRQEITRRWSAAQKNLAETAAEIDTIEILDNSGGRIWPVAAVTAAGVTLFGERTPNWTRGLIEQIEDTIPTFPGRAPREPHRAVPRTREVEEC